MAVRNNVWSAPNSRRYGDQLGELDRLPPRVRRVIHEAITTWCTISIAERYEMLAGKYGEAVAIERVVAWIEECNLREIARFARTNWPAELGVYPAIAARSTMMTYDEARPQK